MYTLQLTDTSFDELLQLGKAAQSTLVLILGQAQGQYQVTVDRSTMNAAEKQKFKNGLAELKKHGIISKLDGTLNTYLIDSNRIRFANTSSIKNPDRPSEAIRNRSKVNAKEQFGNKPDVIMSSVHKFVEKLSAKQERKKQNIELAKRFEESKDRFWSSLEDLKNSGEYPRSKAIKKYHKDIPGATTLDILQACTEFLDETTNEIYFYDIENRIEQKNALYEQFRASAGFFKNNRNTKNKTNLLVEIDEIIRLAKHKDHCYEQYKKGETCTCRNDCIDQLHTLVKEGVSGTKLDASSRKEAEDLRGHLKKWFGERYPELLI